MVNKLKAWWKNLRMAPDERYLSESADMADLEHRMKRLQNGLGPMGYYR